MRPAWMLLAFLCLLATAAGMMLVSARNRAAMMAGQLDHDLAIVAALQLTDLCLTTEARYTRHPAVSDPVAPFMDHPGAIEHFPSGSFFAPSPFFAAGL